MFFNNIPFILRGYVILGGLKIGYNKSTKSFMSFQKINTENQILKEFLDARLQVHKEEAF